MDEAIAYEFSGGKSFFKLLLIRSIRNELKKDTLPFSSSPTFFFLGNPEFMIEILLANIY